MEWTAEEAIGMKEHWERIYQEKESQALSWYQEKPETSLRLIAVATLDMNAGIIDVGAGDSTLVDNLFALGFTNITALDVSSMAICFACQAFPHILKSEKFIRLYDGGLLIGGGFIWLKYFLQKGIFK